MSGTPSPEVACPTCGKSLSEKERTEKRVLCGKEKVPLTGKVYDLSNCRLYEFCSVECVEGMEKEQTSQSEEQKSRITKFLEKLGAASTRCGVDENDICHLTERITGRRDHTDQHTN